MESELEYTCNTRRRTVRRGLSNAAQPNNYRVTAFGDNNVQLAGASVFNIPVVSVEQALASRPDMAIVASGSSRTQQRAHRRKKPAIPANF